MSFTLMAILIVGWICAGMLIARALSLSHVPLPACPPLPTTGPPSASGIRLVRAPIHAPEDWDYIPRARHNEICVLHVVGMTNLRLVSTWTDPYGTRHSLN
jgi:hypothetical protein